MSRNVERYFAERATTFDRQYELPPWARMLTRVLRRAIYQRLDLTFRHAGDVTGRRILDIGCGSGRYRVESARRGAAEVVGVDLAEGMLALARTYTAQNAVTDRVRFERADFADFTDERRLDISIAIGSFDYVLDPQGAFAHAHKLTSGRFLASFPAETFPRSMLRRWRYGRRGVSPRFCGDNEIRSLASKAGFARAAVLQLSAGHFLVADAD